MRYKVYDEEDKKERTLEECVTPLEVGSVRRVQVKKGDTREVHHFRVLEELKSVYKSFQVSVRGRNASLFFLFLPEIFIVFVIRLFITAKGGKNNICLRY